MNSRTSPKLARNDRRFAKFTNSRTNCDSQVFAWTCFQKLRFGLRIACWIWVVEESKRCDKNSRQILWGKAERNDGRYSPLKEITVTSIGDLNETCELALGDEVRSNPGRWTSATSCTLLAGLHKEHGSSIEGCLYCDEK